VGHVVYSGAFGAQNVDALFFVLGQDRCGFLKKHAQTHCTELVSSDPVRYAGHVVLFGVFQPRSIDALFFMLEWDRYGFHKKCNGTC
jgi:hypothetical protein